MVAAYKSLFLIILHIRHDYCCINNHILLAAEVATSYRGMYVHTLPQLYTQR